MDRRDKTGRDPWILKSGFLLRVSEGIARTTGSYQQRSGGDLADLRGERKRGIIMLLVARADNQSWNREKDGWREWGKSLLVEVGCLASVPGKTGRCDLRTLERNVKCWTHGPLSNALSYTLS